MTTVQIRKAPQILRILKYTKYDLVRNLRMFATLFFIVVLPLFMYFIFSMVYDFGSQKTFNGAGTVGAVIMVAMALYGSLTAVISLAGSAAVELSQGWGRQLALTPMSKAGYIVSKILVATVISLLPVLAIYVTGYFRDAEMAPQLWILTALMVIGSGVIFALYGLMYGLLFRSESAVSAASGSLVVLMFLGNAFTPLSGFLMDFSVYTPVWGVNQLVKWPLTEGYYSVNGEFAGQYELWQPLLNIAVWTLVFIIGCMIGVKRHTARK